MVCGGGLVWRGVWVAVAIATDTQKPHPLCFLPPAEQIVDVRTWFNKTCGIPLEDLVGMRDPFLINNPGTRKVRKLKVG